MEISVFVKVTNTRPGTYITDTLAKAESSVRVDTDDFNLDKTKAELTVALRNVHLQAERQLEEHLILLQEEKNKKVAEGSE